MSTRMSGSPTREGWPCISACWAWCRCRHLAGPAEAAPTDRLTLTGNANDTTVTMHLLTQDGHHHTWGEIHWADFFTGCVREHQTTDPTRQTWSGLLRESSVKRAVRRRDPGRLRHAAVRRTGLLGTRLRQRLGR